MKLTRAAKELYDDIAGLTIIDAHEHLPSEEAYLAFEYCGPNMFAGGYLWHDLESAGLSPDFKATLRDGGYRPVEAWWPHIRPYWEYVRESSYARALRITVHDLFGLSDINDTTIHVLAERVRQENRPGLYGQVLGARCGIRVALTNTDQACFPSDPLLRGVPPLDKVGGMGAFSLEEAPFGRGAVRQLAEYYGRPVLTLEDAREAVQAPLRADMVAGAAAFKLFAGPFGRPDARAAAAELKEALRPASESGHFVALRDYLLDASLDVAAQYGVPISVHAGYFGDFRRFDPKHLLSFGLRRRDVHFDLFHLGVPMLRDAVLIGKTLPNVSLNLTWCPILSQVQTIRMLDEILDLVPLNKVIAFGGDYRVAVHKVYGHLVMAREVVAAALSRRIVAGDFDREYALRIARWWFHDNPARIYRLTDVADAAAVGEEAR